MIRSKREPRLETKESPFPYQVEAVEALKDLEYGAIFHEQGLGKTKIAIDLALSWLHADSVDSVMLVTKKALVENWRSELVFHTYVKPCVLSQDRKQNYYLFNSPARVYLTHYEVCRSEEDRLQLFLKTRRVGVILDEAHKIKNPDSTTARALLNLSKGFTRRVIMTGTPVANRPFDIWAQVKFLDGGKALGNDFKAFKKEFDLTKDLADSQRRKEEFASSLAATVGLIADFTVRETKESSGLTLPTKEIRSLRVELEDNQASLYREFRNELRAVIVRDGLPTVDRADDVLKRLLRLVQVASNPRLIDESYDNEPGKVAHLESIVYEALADGSKVIVWTSFTDNADWLARRLRPLGSARVHGKMTIDARNRSISKFKSDRSVRVLVATPGAAKEGLTLTVANKAVFFDRGFSLDDYLQAQDRIHRISQTKACIIYNLIASGTVDEWVDELLAAKHLAAKLLQGDIDEAEYREAAGYDFVRILREVLEVE